MNGEECHNEWEITFEEIHRNGAIAYAIFNYTRYTADESYIPEMGLEVLIGIARFWAQRVSFSTPKNKYVMLGVTGQMNMKITSITIGTPTILPAGVCSMQPSKLR